MAERRQIGPGTLVKASEQGLFSELGEGSVIMHLHEGVYYGISDVGTSIWKSIQEPIPFSDLIDRLLEEYEVERRPCEEDAESFLLGLEEKGLVTFDA